MRTPKDPTLPRRYSRASAPPAGRPAVRPSDPRPPAAPSPPSQVARGKAHAIDGIVTMAFDRVAPTLHVIVPQRIMISSPIENRVPTSGCSPNIVSIKSVKSLPSSHTITCFQISARKPDLAMVGLTNAMFFTYNVKTGEVSKPKRLGDVAADT